MDYCQRFEIPILQNDELLKSVFADSFIIIT